MAQQSCITHQGWDALREPGAISGGSYFCRTGSTLTGGTVSPAPSEHIYSTPPSSHSPAWFTNTDHTHTLLWTNLQSVCRKLRPFCNRKWHGHHAINPISPPYSLSRWLCISTVKFEEEVATRHGGGLMAFPSRSKSKSFHWKPGDCFCVHAVICKRGFKVCLALPLWLVLCQPLVYTYDTQMWQPLVEPYWSVPSTPYLWWWRGCHCYCWWW